MNQEKEGAAPQIDLQTFCSKDPNRLFIEQSTKDLLARLQMPGRSPGVKAQILQEALAKVEEHREEVMVNLIEENGRIGERLTELRAALAEATQWFLVEDEMPDADTTVLMFHAEWDEPVEPGYFNGDCWCSADGHALIWDGSPTHWRHFPEPPTLESEVAR